MIGVLLDKGGIIVNAYTAAVEDFNWVKNISSNIYVNRGNRNTVAKVVGFYSSIHSSQKTKEMFKGA